MSVEGTPILVGGGLATAGHTLTAQAQAIEDELNGLRSRLAPLAQAWAQSKAAGFYQERMSEWDSAARTLFGSEAEVGVLGTIAAVVNQSYHNYQVEEEGNIRTWQTG